MTVLFVDESSSQSPVCGVNPCPECGRLNILPEAEYVKLIQKTEFDSNVSELMRTVHKMSPRNNYVRYHLGADKEQLFNGADVKCDQNHFVAKDDDGLDMIGAMRRYRETLASFKDFEVPKVVKGTTPNPGLIETAQFMSAYLNRNYSNQKKLAISNIINHIGGTASFGYGKYLRYTERAYYEGALASEPILDEMVFLTDNAFYRCATSICDALNVDFNLMSINSLPKNEVTKILKKEFKRLRNDYEEFLDIREHSIKMIKDNLNELSNLHITRGSVSQEELADFLYDPEVRSVIETWADRMIVANSIEEFTTYFYAKDFSSERKFYSTSYSPVDFYTAVSDKANSKFGINVSARDLAQSIYPGVNIPEVLNYMVEVHNAYGTDSYIFYVKLEQFLNKIPNGDIAFLHMFGNKSENKLLLALKKFLDKHGRSKLDSLVYCYGSEFTIDEIKEYLNSNYIYSVKTTKYVAKRKDGETFVEYCKRLEGKDFDIREHDYIVKHDDDEILKYLKRYYVQLDAVYITAMTCLGQINTINHYFKYKSIFEYIMSPKCEFTVLDILNVDLKKVNYLLNSDDVKPINIDYEEYKRQVDATSVFVKDSDVNVNLRSRNVREGSEYLYRLGVEEGDDVDHYLNTLVPEFKDDTYRRAFYELVNPGDSKQRNVGR